MTAYIVIPSARLSRLVGRTGFLQRETVHVRLSVDRTRAILGYSGPKPKDLSDYEAAFGVTVSVLTEAQAQALMETAAWKTDAAPWRLLIKRPEQINAPEKAPESFISRHKWEICVAAAGVAATVGAALWYCFS